MSEERDPKVPMDRWSIEPPNDSVGIIARSFPCPDCASTGKDREGNSCSECGGHGSRARPRPS